jgi:hypothetical protein
MLIKFDTNNKVDNNRHILTLKHRNNNIDINLWDPKLHTLCMW